MALANHCPVVAGVEALFEMALQAHAVGFGDQKFIVIRTVRSVACHTVFGGDSFVFVDEGAFHFHMTIQADAVHTVPGGLVKCSVGIVTILAVDLALQNTMAEGKAKIRDLGLNLISVNRIETVGSN